MLASKHIGSNVTCRLR